MKAFLLESLHEPFWPSHTGDRMGVTLQIRDKALWCYHTNGSIESDPFRVQYSTSLAGAVKIAMLSQGQDNDHDSSEACPDLY